ncbi:MAG: ABC transporter permease [Bacteroidetes bacterium]|nr:MAG: ABC transporter permease [Bacteroidota bacterium]
MNSLLFILEKEFIQIFRDKRMLAVIFIMPLLQLFVLIFAATNEMKHINLYVVDNDMSTFSKRLINKLEGSSFFYVQNSSFSIEKAKKELLKDKADLIIDIPQGFERDLVRENKSKVQLLINAVNGSAAQLTYVYSMSVIAGFNKNIIAERVNMPANMMSNKNISVVSSFWYNPGLNYKFYMLPGILVILVTVIGMFLSSLNIVREKEIGTIEQINVTPIKKYQFVLGKLIPFLLIGLFDLGFGLVLGKLIFDIPIVGSLFTLFSFATVYLLLVLSMGFFVSTITETQQQAMLIAWFFMIVFLLMSGLFTPFESMPTWAQNINVINPLAYFMRVIRMVLLKGSGFADIAKDFFIIMFLSVIVFSLSVWRYRKVA